MNHTTRGGVGVCVLMFWNKSHTSRSDEKRKKNSFFEFAEFLSAIKVNKKLICEICRVIYSREHYYGINIYIFDTTQQQSSTPGRPLEVSFYDFITLTKKK